MGSWSLKTKITRADRKLKQMCLYDDPRRYRRSARVSDRLLTFLDRANHLDKTTFVHTNRENKKMMRNCYSKKRIKFWQGQW